MTKDQYLEMMEQMGEEPDWEKCPPDWGDFPELIVTTMNLFHSLGDRVYPDIGYIGKDYTNLSYYLEIYNVEDKEFFLELLTWLDSRAVQTSQEQMKREQDKLKRKK